MLRIKPRPTKFLLEQGVQTLKWLYKRTNICFIHPKVVQKCYWIADHVIKMLTNSVYTLMFVSCPYWHRLWNTTNDDENDDECMNEWMNERMSELMKEWINEYNKISALPGSKGLLLTFYWFS